RRDGRQSGPGVAPRGRRGRRPPRGRGRTHGARRAARGRHGRIGLGQLARGGCGVNAFGLARALRELVRVPSQIAGAVSDAINDRIQAGFDQGTDPYGSPWAELAPYTLAKGRTPPPLTESGGLRG